MRKILVALLMALSIQALGQVQETTLANGLKVLVREDHRAPVAVFMIWYRVGSADEPGDLTGVSHAIEHMMFKGTPKTPVGMFSKTIAAKGGKDNAFTSSDYTAYFEQIDSAQLETSFQLESDRMEHLLLDPNEFAKEIKVIQEERRLRTDNNPQALAFERFLATAHLSAPYQHPVIGWMSSLKKMNVSDVKSWYQRFYSPNNATIVVVGDTNMQQVSALAQKYFGSLQSKPTTPRRAQSEPPALGKKSITVHAPAQLPLIMVGYTAPSVVTAKNQWEPYALELITAILDGGESARFTKNLIREQHVATAASAYYNLYARYATQFIVYAMPSEKTQLSDLEHHLISELDVLKKEPLSEQELRRVKKQLIAQKTFEKDSIFSQAMELGLLETVGLGWSKANEYNQAINQITPAQIQQTAQRYFQELNRTQAELIPTPSSEARS